MNCAKFAYLLLAVIFLFSCKKNKEKENPPPFKAEGKLYWNLQQKLQSYDLATKKVSEVLTLPFGLSNIFMTSLAYDSGLVYSASLYGACALDITTGTVKWSTPYSSGAFATSEGSRRATISIKDSLLYVVGLTGSSGQKRLYALHKKTGAIKWFKDLSKTFNAADFPSVAIAGDKIIVPATNGQWDSDLSSLMCLNRITGELIWEKPYQEFITCVPVVRNNIAYIRSVSFSGVFAVDINTGNTLWSTGLPKHNIEYKMLIGVNDLVVQSGNEWDTCTIYYLDYMSGALKDAKHIGRFYSWLNTGDNHVVSQGRYITAYSNSSRTQLWQTEKPVVHQADTMQLKSWEESALMEYEDHLVILARASKLSLPNVHKQPPFGEFYFVNKSTGVFDELIKLDETFVPSGNAVHFILFSNNKMYRSNIAGSWNE